MAKISTIYTLITADDAPLKRGLRSARGEAVKGAKGIQSAINKINFRAVGLAAAAAGAAMGLVIKKTVGLAMEQEAAEKRLAAVLRSTGEAAGFNIGELKAMASAMQEVTTTGDETTLAGMAILATFKQIRKDAFRRTMMSALDLSEVMQQDLRSSVVMLGKALNDPVANLGALSRAGIQFTKDQKTLIKGLWQTGKQAKAQELILVELESQFGGAAKAAKNTFGGALQSLQNDIGDIGEKIGFALMPTLKTIIDDFNKFIRINQDFINSDLPTAIDAAARSVAFLAREMVATAKIAGDFWDAVSPKRAIENSQTIVDRVGDIWKELTNKTKHGIAIEIWQRITDEFDELGDAIAESDAQLDNLGGGLESQRWVRPKKSMKYATKEKEGIPNYFAGMESFKYTTSESYRLVVADSKAAFEEMETHVSDYTDYAETAYQTLDSRISLTFNSAADAVAEFAVSGKLNFKDFANSLIADLVRMQTRMAMMQLFNAGMSYAGRTSMYETGGGVMEIGGVGTKKEFHQGGHIGEPIRGVGLRSGQSYEFNANETVIPDSKLGGGGSKVIINHNNYTGQPANTTQSMGPGGEKIINISVGNSILQGGPEADAISMYFGLQPVGKRI